MQPMPSSEISSLANDMHVSEHVAPLSQSQTPSPKQNFPANAIQPLSILLISDQDNLRHIRDSLQYNGCTVQTARIDEFCSPHTRHDMLELMKTSPPSVLWIHAPCWDINLKTEDQRRIAITFAIMLSYQLASPKHHVVIEGDLGRYRNWYPDRLRRSLANPRLSVHNVWWCALGMHLSNKPICRYSKLMCTLPQLLPSIVKCCGALSKHAYRNFKASRTILQEFQQKLHDVLVPLLQGSDPSNADVFTVQNVSTVPAAKQSRPTLPKKIKGPAERLDLSLIHI